MKAAEFERIETLGTIGKWGQSPVEVNIGAWNGGKPKFDIRAWNYDRCSKGLRLTKEEAKQLMYILIEYFREDE